MRDIRKECLEYVKFIKQKDHEGSYLKDLLIDTDMKPFLELYRKQIDEIVA